MLPWMGITAPVVCVLPGCVAYTLFSYTSNNGGWKSILHLWNLFLLTQQMKENDQSLTRPQGAIQKQNHLLLTELKKATHHGRLFFRLYCFISHHLSLFCCALCQGSSQHPPQCPKLSCLFFQFVRLHLLRS